MEKHVENLQSCLFKSLEVYSTKWMEMHRSTMDKYIWVKDPLHWWSRTYEYVFHIKYINAELERRFAANSNAVQVLDAGAGTDFISWYFLEQSPQGRVIMTAADYDAKNGNNHAEINARYTGIGKPWMATSFVLCPIQKMPLDDAKYDILFSVSVLEHTDKYNEIVAEFHRVLKPGGLLVLTFDIDLVDTGVVPPSRAFNLLGILRSHFEEVGGAASPASSPEEFDKLVHADTVATSGRIYQGMTTEEWTKVHKNWRRDTITFHCSVWRKAAA